MRKQGNAKPLMIFDDTRKKMRKYEIKKRSLFLIPIALLSLRMLLVLQSSNLRKAMLCYAAIMAEDECEKTNEINSFTQVVCHRLKTKAITEVRTEKRIQTPQLISTPST